MIKFPDEYVKIPRCPGYYWNLETKVVYSIKSGILKPLTKKKPYSNHPEGYALSVNGRRILWPMYRLMWISKPVEDEIVDFGII